MMPVSGSTNDISHLFLVLPANKYFYIYPSWGFCGYRKVIHNTPATCGVLSSCVTHYSFEWCPLSGCVSKLMTVTWELKTFLQKVRGLQIIASEKEKVCLV